MPSAPDPAFHAQLDTSVPRQLELGSGTAIFVLGSAAHARSPVAGLEIDVDGRRTPAMASRMPRLDRDTYRSGFWAVVPFPAAAGPGEAEISLVARLEGGGESRAALARVRLTESDRAPAPAANGATVAICMATHNPDPGLFAAQVESIRAQTDPDWVCVVSDDDSDPTARAAIEEVLGDDRRFHLSRSERRLGVYRNFERALALAPRSAALVAIADQDDRWHPEKVAALRAGLGGARLVYSDQRVVGADGAVLRETFWSGRRNNHTNLTSLLIANTVTGAASLMRRELLDDALPFPAAPGEPYHDHWLALVAILTGGIAYLDRPLYDYVQHEASVLGHAGANTVPGRGGLAPLRRILRGQRPAVGWRSLYFFEYCRLALFATVLLLRCGDRMRASDRHSLERFLRAETSPLRAAALGARSARGLWGRNETLGAERRLAAGLLWRQVLPLLPDAAGRRLAHDSSLPERGPREMRGAE
jgi:glycosyltransferase involved in cell wall biosynthesis